MYHFKTTDKMLFEFALQRWSLQRFGIRFFNFMQKKSKQSLVYIA